MADVISRRSIVYDLTFNTTQAKKGASDIGSAMKGAEQQIDKATQSVDEFSAKTLSSVARLRQLKNELNNFKGTEAQFQKLSLEAARLQDQINNTNQRIRTLASSTRNIQAFASAFQGITGIFTAVQGAQAVFGKESENVTRALVKLQGALALLQGVQAAVATVTEQSAAKTVVMNAVTKAYTFVTTGATAATKLFRGAMIATGVGAAIVALTAIVTYWKDIAEWIGISTDNAEEYAEAQKKASDEARKAISDQNAAFKERMDLRALEDGGVNELKRRVDALKATGASEKEIFEAQQAVRARELKDITEFAVSVIGINNEHLHALEMRKAKEAEIENARTEFLRNEAEKREAIRRKLLAGENIKFEQTELEKLRKEIAQAFGIDEDSAKDLGTRFGEAFKKALAEEMERKTGGLEPKTELIDVPKATEQIKTLADVIKESSAQITGDLASIFSNLGSLAKEGSDAQIALSIANIFAANAEALANAIASAARLQWPANIPAIISSVATITGMFAQVNALISKAKSAQANVQAFAEGEVDIHRDGETRGKDSIPAVIMPGESVITTDKTKRYKPFLEAIHNGSLEDLIRVDYVEPALALKALEQSAHDSKQVDYSDRFYRQYLATGEGNINGKRMLMVLASIDRKLTPKKQNLRN